MTPAFGFTSKQYSPQQTGPSSNLTKAGLVRPPRVTRQSTSKVTAKKEKADADLESDDDEETANRQIPSQGLGFTAAME